MKKLFKNRITEAKFGDANFTVAHLVTICIVGFLMVFASTSAVFGLNTNQDIANLVGAQQADKSEKLQTEVDYDVEEFNAPKSQFADIPTNSNLMEAFHVDWYTDYNVNTYSYRTPVYYQYEYEDPSTHVKSFLNLDENFASTSFRRDFAAHGISINNRGVVTWDDHLARNETYREAHFDVRYYEDFFTSVGGKSWSYAGSYFQIGTDKYDMTKCTFFNIASGTYAGNYILYRDDTNIADSGTNYGWKYRKMENGETVGIYLTFKDFTDAGSDAIDFHAYWGGSTHDPATTPNLLVQYMYDYKNPEGETEYFSHANPPFAADCDLAYNTSSQIGTTNGFTFSGFTGRFSTNTATTGKTFNAVYRFSAVCTPIEASKIPSGTISDWYSCAIWKAPVTNTAYRYDGQGDADNGWRYTDSDGTKYLFEYELDENGKYKVYTDESGNKYFKETTRKYAGVQAWANIIYEYDAANVTTGLNNTELGVTINMYDYDTWLSKSNTSAYKGGINDGHLYHFASGSYQSGEHDINTYIGSASRPLRRADIWKNLISNSNGYPDVHDDQASTGAQDENLAYLFDDTRNMYKRSYKKINGLFDADIYNMYGYFVYTSDQNGIDVGTHHFPGHFAQVRKRADEDRPVNNGESAMGGDLCLYEDATSGTTRFMPYNDHGNTDEGNNDFHFGMTIETPFMQPVDGISTETGSEGLKGPMIFYFHGDDDVFVYDDNVLMLDLGGIHNSIDGTINYNTGKIVANNATEWMDERHYDAAVDHTEYPSMTDYFPITTDAEGKITFPDGWEPALAENQTLEQWLAQPANDKHYRFADRTTHRMKFYYFERGTGESNCTIAFNLQALPEGTIVVNKEVEKGSSSVGALDGDFYYRVEVSRYIVPEEETEEPYWAPWEPYIVKDPDDGTVYYNVYDSDTGALLREKQKPDENGVIYIKDNQYATLSGFKELDKFKIAECDPGSTVSGEVALMWGIPEISVERDPAGRHKADSQEFIGGQTWYGTHDLQVGDGLQNSVTFYNTANAASFFDLRIKKRECNNERTNLLIGFNGGTDTDRKPINIEYYNGKYDLYDDSGVIEAGKTCTNGRISLEDGQYAVIHNVQMKTRASVQVIDPAREATYATMQTSEAPGDSFKAGQMYDSYPVTSDWEEDDWSWYETAPTNLYAARIPMVIRTEEHPLPTDDRYGEIDFIVENLANNLTLKKSVSTEDSDQKTQQYPLWANLYTNDAGDAPYYPLSEGAPVTYEGYLERVSGTESITDIEAQLDENGKLGIRDKGTTGDFVDPKLADQDTLVIYSILPLKEESTFVHKYTVSERKTGLKWSDWKKTNAFINDAGTAYEMSGEDVLISTLVPSSSLEEVQINDSIRINNDFGGVVPTAYNIMKNPEIWTLFLVALMLVVFAAPTQILRKYRAKMAYKDLPTLKIGTERFEI